MVAGYDGFQQAAPGGEQEYGMENTGVADLRRLANGLTVAMEPLPYLHSVAAGLWIRTGSANEKASESGLAHVLEHLFFKGTESRTVHQIMSGVEGRGGHINAFTSREYTCLFVKMPSRHITEGIAILADLLKNSRFADLEKERNVILEEIAAIQDTPEDCIHDLLSEFHWPDHPLGRSISGRKETVSAFLREDVRRFFDTWYKPDRMVFSLAGNFNQDALFPLIEEEFGDIDPGCVPGGNGCPDFNSGIRAYERDISQTHVSMAFPGPPAATEKQYIGHLASNLLGGGSTSRLFERIREEEGLAYSIYSFDSCYRRTGMSGIYAAIAPENLGRTLDLIYAELRRFREETVPEDELETAREQIKGSMQMALENTFTRMSRMAKSVFFYDRIVPLEEVLAKIDAVTAEDIRAFAAETFQPENCALVTLGPAGAHMDSRVSL
jgi:predicted Zn-dependent peptidase